MARISAFTNVIQHSAVNSSQFNKAGKGNKRHTDQKRRNRTVPMTEDTIAFVENFKFYPKIS